MGSRHSWKRTDDIVAFYLSRYGARGLGIFEPEISKRLGMTEAALTMRQSNFKSLSDGAGHLSHASQQTISVYAEYSRTSEAELREHVRRILVL